MVPGAKDSTLPMALVSEPSSEEDDGCRVSCRAQGCFRSTQLLHSHSRGHFVCWGLSEDGAQCMMCGTASCGGDRREGNALCAVGQGSYCRQISGKGSDVGKSMRNGVPGAGTPCVCPLREAARQSPTLGE